MTQYDKDIQAFVQVCDLKEILEKAKPNDKSPKDRYYAIISTDLEKIYTMFKTFILDDEG